jgi:oxygen-independent coproporphyrinogen-3 oxidase
MREMGFNRVSLGVQTFHDRHLQALGRIHTAAQAEEAFLRARARGLPAAQPRPHLRAAGTDGSGVEIGPGDGRSRCSRSTCRSTTSPSKTRRSSAAGTSWAARLPTRICRPTCMNGEWTARRKRASAVRDLELRAAGRGVPHNQIYWRQEPYVGFGTGAASYSEGARWTNTASMQRYLATAGRASGRSTL